MKKFVEPQMTVLSIVLDENIASSSGNGNEGNCPFGESYSSTKQECINCKLYYNAKKQLPVGIECGMGIMTFCNQHGLGFSSKEEAESTAALLGCPAGM